MPDPGESKPQNVLPVDEKYLISEAVENKLVSSHVDKKLSNPMSIFSGQLQSCVFNFYN